MLVRHVAQRAVRSFTIRALSTGAKGDQYIISPEKVAEFRERGYITLEGFLTEAEIKPIEEIYNRFMKGEIKVEGKDFCDMSAGFDRKPEDFSIVNAMLPRKYYPKLIGNIYEKRSASVAAQLFPDVKMTLDYDQLLNKRPRKTDAVFAWHQDMAYWPPVKDSRTCTFSLAVDPTTRANGCLRFIPGSHKSKVIRPHKPVGKTREEAHAVAIEVDETKEHVDYVEVPRGAVTVHDEYVVHGSGGNATDGTRRTYVIAYRTAATVAQERAAGFTHSHNDTVNWDTFNKWQE